MSTYLIPTDDKLVDEIAKTMAKNRLMRDAEVALASLTAETGRSYQDVLSESMLEMTIDRIFDALWNGTTENDEFQRSCYREDALAAIRIINLRLITATS